MARLTLQATLRDAARFAEWLQDTKAHRHHNLQAAQQFSDVWVFTGASEDLEQFEMDAREQSFELDRVELEQDEEPTYSDDPYMTQPNAAR